jgi:hypothetical protein
MGERIAGASIEIYSMPSATPDNNEWLDALHKPVRASTHADRSGETTIALAIGYYAAYIVAKGFEGRFERIEIRDASTLSLKPALSIDQSWSGYSGPVDYYSSSRFPTESYTIDVLLPLEPLQTISVHARKAHRRWW